jgi:transposase
MHRIVVYRPVTRLAHDVLVRDLRSMHPFSKGRRTENARIGAETTAEFLPGVIVFLGGNPLPHT